MHYALSNENQGDQKLQKVKTNSGLIFERKQVNPFSNDEKLPKFCKQINFKDFFEIFGHFWAKN